MRTKEEAIIFAKAQFENNPIKEKQSAMRRKHYGKGAVLELLDFIYEEKNTKTSGD